MHTKIAIASDHAGFELKEKLIKNFSGYEFIDLGTTSEASVDYPDYADKLVDYLLKNENAFGILICGSGIGMSIKANRNKHIRAALCFNTEYAKLARAHNDANVLVLGARFLDFETVKEMVETFITTEFAGGRHKERVDKL